jgi:hypothetical protein
MAWLSAVYRLALRTTQGLLSSVLKLLKVALPVPDTQPYVGGFESLQ